MRHTYIFVIDWQSRALVNDVELSWSNRLPRSVSSTMSCAINDGMNWCADALRRAVDMIRSNRANEQLRWRGWWQSHSGWQLVSSAIVRETPIDSTSSSTSDMSMTILRIDHRHWRMSLKPYSVHGQTHCAFNRPSIVDAISKNEGDDDWCCCYAGNYHYPRTHYYLISRIATRSAK